MGITAITRRIGSCALAGILAMSMASGLVSVTPDEAQAATIKMSAKAKTLTVGKTCTLKVKGTKAKVKWSSTNKRVATVSTKGKVKAKKMGTATIKAKVGKKTYTCKVTVKPKINASKKTVNVGKTYKLKLTGAVGTVKWSSSNKKVATVGASTGTVKGIKAGTATITAKIKNKKVATCKVVVKKVAASNGTSNSGSNGGSGGTNSGTSTTAPSKPGTVEEELIRKVSSYTYRVSPVNGRLNNIVFVETNNPDPYSFQLADESSKYLAEDEVAIYRLLPYVYADVAYTDESTRRIANKGYLFYCYNCNSDGGSLRVLANRGYSYTKYANGNTYFYNYISGKNYRTDKTINMTTLEDRADYLIRTCTVGKSSFFEKLSAVQLGLNGIALYPKNLLDTAKPNENAHPYLAVSPYPELFLSARIGNMFKEAGDGLFLDAAYGFVLDSLSFPGMMGKVARRLEPACTVAAGFSHAYIDVTFNGVTKTYGGNGSGGSNPLYSKYVNWQFRFDGTDKGYGTNPSMDTMRNARISCASKSSELSQVYLDQLSMKTITAIVGQGAWIRCAGGGVLGNGKPLCYVTMTPYGDVRVASSAWVDGRYVNEYETYQPGAKFGDYPTSKIVLSNVTYKKRSGTSVTGNVTYSYSPSTDDWRAQGYYGIMYASEDLAVVAPSLVLTRERVEAMAAAGQIDGKTNEVPTKGYIYDGTVKPGTYSSALAQTD